MSVVRTWRPGVRLGRRNLHIAASGVNGRSGLVGAPSGLSCKCLAKNLRDQTCARQVMVLAHTVAVCVVVRG